MKYIKLFENFNNMINIPDDLAEWCIELIGTQPIKPYDLKKIPHEIFIQSKNFVNKNTNGLIWRGFGLWDKLSIQNNNLNNDNSRTFKYDWGASWSYSKDIAYMFAESRKNEEQYGYLAEYNINNIKYPIVLDIVLKNLTDKQLHFLKEKYLFDIKEHTQEYEVIIMEEFKVPLKNIEHITNPY